MRRFRYALFTFFAAAGALFALLYGDTLLTWQYRDAGEEWSGGAATVFDASINAFGHPAPGLPREQELRFFEGSALFNQSWVGSPSPTTARDGLGPLFNARSCAGCHFKDGRGRPPATDDERGTGLLVRLLMPEGAVHPHLGAQLHDQAIPGIAVEGRIEIYYETVTGMYADGTPYTLRAPRYALADSAQRSDGVRLSPRVGAQIVGLGLLESVPQAELLALADPDDVNGDGISGRPNYVPDVQTGALVQGRFGWKANEPTLLQQSASAFHNDLGITSSLFPAQNCAPAQTDCLSAPHGGIPEIEDGELEKILLYVSARSVPARRDWNEPQVLRGKSLFAAANCSACHAPVLRTGYHPDVPALSEQTIRPYTDLLLHDMGSALADGVPDGSAGGSEWRTPPLWGIGLIETVNAHSSYLHDGRARSLEEAILWHGGEAEAARQAFLQMSIEERAALIAFLKSL